MIGIPVPSGGASAFIGLTDTPASYSGQAGKFPTVKSTEDGLEFTSYGHVDGGNASDTYVGSPVVDGGGA